MKPNRTPVLNLIEAAPSAEEASDDADGRDLELGPPPLADDQGISPLLRHLPLSLGKLGLKKCLISKFLWT